MIVNLIGLWRIQIIKECAEYVCECIYIPGSVNVSDMNPQATVYME